MISKKIVIGQDTEYPLNGLLTLPDDPSGPVPAVVLVHGSGPSNMDERVMKLTPFRDLAEGLAQHGIASVRYDKRTYAHARKMKKTRPTVWEETIEDALLAAALLRKEPQIDADRIFLLGHSQGAMLAPRIDAQGADVTLGHRAPRPTPPPARPSAPGRRRADAAARPAAVDERCRDDNRRR